MRNVVVSNDLSTDYLSTWTTPSSPTVAFPESNGAISAVIRVVMCVVAFVLFFCCFFGGRGGGTKATVETDMQGNEFH